MEQREAVGITAIFGVVTGLLVATVMIAKDIFIELAKFTIPGGNSILIGNSIAFFLCIGAIGYYLWSYKRDFIDNSFPPTN